MKRYFSFAFALLCGLTMSAEGYSFLNVAKVTGESEGNALSSFTKITFSDGQMHLLNGASQVKSYDLSSLRKMWLSTTSGIRNIQNSETNRPAEIYLMSGKRVNADPNNLPKGVYIIKEGNVTRKLIRR